MTGPDIRPPESDAAAARSEHDHLAAAREQLLDAMLPHVPFDGWSRAALDMAAAEAGTDAELARLAFPRGGIDAAIAFHRRGDRLMAGKMADAALSSMRIRDRIAFAVRARLEAAADHKEAVRRSAALFALPIHAAEGARLIWDTADAIWNAVGDDSEDVNWYTKRATLAGVYSSAALYWLGDDSPGSAATWSFIDRRIDDVMRIEKLKASFRSNPFGQAFLRGPGRVFDMIRAPGAAPRRRPFGPRRPARAPGPQAPGPQG